MVSYRLLSTKLALPRAHPSLVARTALLAWLDAGLDHKLTLLSAPAGFGKTTLVSTWIAAHRERGDPLPVAWVSLDGGDNDPVRFWRYIITACQAFSADDGDGADGSDGQAALALLQRAQPPFEFESALTTLINALARRAGKAILVLEDYHAITSGRVHETMAFLLEHLPATLHVMVLARGDPPLPLARLRAQNDLNELRAADLRFSPAETQAFLQQVAPFPLAPELIARLGDRTEGWAAGLRMVGLALQAQQTPPQLAQFATTFTGSHRPILEYLVADVLCAQPPPIQTFLLQTAFLGRLCAGLCDAVTGRTGSAAILAQLERANLFLAPLDGTPQWYRFHTLFAEAMQQHAWHHLGEERLRELSYRASLWHEEHGLLPEAIEGALAAQAFTRAADLIERIILPRLVQNDHHTLRRWMEQLPAAELRAHPALCLSYAIAVLFTHDRHTPLPLELIQAPLQVAERYWRANGNQHKVGEVLAFRAMVAWWQRDAAQAFALARQARELLSADETEWLGISLIFVGAQALAAGRLNDARHTLTQAMACCEAAGNMYGTLNITLLLGEVWAGQGELHQAQQLYRRALAEVERAPMDLDDALVRSGQALLGLAQLAYEWNDLAAAEQDATRAVEIGRQLADEELRVRGTLVLACLRHARAGNARPLLQTLVAETKQPALLREVQSCQARLALASGDLAAAQRWSDALGPCDDVPLMQQEYEALTRARLLLAQRQAEAALALLECWQASAHAQGRGRRQLEMLMLTALAYAARGDFPGARRMLIRALAQAQPEGHRRLFLDAGEPLALLLQAVLPGLHEASLAGYVRGLLEAQGRCCGGQELAAVLVEPLSAQEQRVLRLLAVGMSYQEIAQELVVSINTVKTHIKAIYRKLQVDSRSEARAAARQLALA